MADKMQRFIDIERAMPDKRDVDHRQTDFDEIYRSFSTDQAEHQASRCEQCGIPFCQIHCPLQNNIPDWLKLSAEGRLEEAYHVSQATNTFPEICGRICPQDRLCEGSCVLEQSKHGTVTIGAVEKYITDTAWAEGWVEPPHPVDGERDQSVGIIGAGPGGLAAADLLRRDGYDVHVYDRYDRVGGLMIYGIPGFKLEKHIVQQRAAHFEQAGVTFHMNFEVGRDATLAELRNRHDAILIATGVYKARDIMLPGAGLDGVVPALDFLTASNRKGLGDSVPDFDSGKLNALGKHVVVVGGGDTAMDCVRTAVRQGAKKISCLYRRDRANMPGSMNEVGHAEEEGVDFIWLSAPEAFLGDDHINAVRASRMRLGLPDATGRQRPEPVEDSTFTLQPVEDSTFTLQADMAITALGFEPEDLPTLFSEDALQVSRVGTITVNPTTQMSNLPGVFAAGDIVRGASLVVWAIKDGRDAAMAMHNYIQAHAAAAALMRAAG